MSKVTGEDKIKIVFIRNSIRVASTVEKMKENRLAWLGHVSRKKYTDAIKLTITMYFEGKWWSQTISIVIMVTLLYRWIDRTKIQWFYTMYRKLK